jgi:2-polyprenyl-3-methyl-5-hydroxy-6-metoxy-1,4-benzoquinol methylase
MNKEDYYNMVKLAKVIDKDSFLVAQCKGKRVLDVGCVGQSRGYETSEWLFNKFNAVAKSVTGVDVNEEGIALLKREGLNVVSRTELQSISEQYDVIIMSDVIEHVDNPGQLLLDYSAYLASEGRIIITTPNSTRARTFVEILVTGRYSLNPEHTMWFCPNTLIELVSRTVLRPVEIFWLKEYGYDKYRSPTSLIVYLLTSVLCLLRKQYRPNFMMILAK